MARRRRVSLPRVEAARDQHPASRRRAPAVDGELRPPIRSEWLPVLR